MAWVLGIHIGHHAACAVVHDGRLVAAIQQERLTRIKHDGEEALSDRLPIEACLRAANVSIAELDLIVSSFQAVSPGSFGLHKPLIEQGFTCFDPFDDRHFVSSHHLAHAYSAVASARFKECAVLVCDLGGSTTVDGQDFFMPFGSWYKELTGVRHRTTVSTECLSVYHYHADSMHLYHREFCVPHNQPESFIQNIASLYDNVSRRIFGSEHAHGQLMGLSAYGAHPVRCATNCPTYHMIDIATDGCVSFRNDWQHRVPADITFEEQADLAHDCQAATEQTLLAYASRATRLTASRNIALAGGVFLNIPSNTRISNIHSIDAVSVPSAPHDAGIAIGAAFGGATKRFKQPPVQVCSDRMGLLYPESEVESILRAHEHLLSMAAYSADRVAAKLNSGQIVARWAGRGEFGPRALGGRSLFGSPLLRAVKEKMNTLKGRQPWRPLAPIVPLSECSTFFEGPSESPWMNYGHTIRERYRQKLKALHHPDHSTRVQTLTDSEDAQLYELLITFGNVTGFPMLVNTSFNLAGDPMVETPEQALRMFEAVPTVDSLMIGTWVVQRLPPWSSTKLRLGSIRLPSSAVLARMSTPRGNRHVCAVGKASVSLSKELYSILGTLREARPVGEVLDQIQSDQETSQCLYEMLLKQVVLFSSTSR